MPAPSYTPISLYYSTTAAAVPVNTNLVNGELAINITDGKLFYKDNGGVVQVLATKGSAVVAGADRQIQFNNAGALGADSTFVYDATGNLLVGTATGVTGFGKTINLYNSANTGNVASNAYMLVQSANRNAVVELSGAATSVQAINFSTTPGTTISGLGCTTSLGNLFFKIGATQVGTFDSAGRFLIGTPTASGANLLQVNSDALINGITVGQGFTSAANNTAVGSSALSSTTGTNNSGFGATTLQANTTGGSNTAVGVAAAAANTTGSSNTAIGVQALNANTTASNNTAVGYQAGYSNTTGTGVTAIGYKAGYANSTTSYSTSIGFQALLNSTAGFNTAVGANAMNANITGVNNTAVGVGALETNTAGSGNVAMGHQALDQSTADNNTALGYQAGLSNTTGTANVAVGGQALQANTTADNNTAVGYQAGYSNTTGSVTALGYQAGYGNTTGSQNTAVGFQSISANSTGANNTALGFFSGGVTTGSSNTFIGNYSGGANTAGSNNTAVGDTALRFNVTSSNNTVIGKDSGKDITGSNNTILGCFPGNNGGLDIRTLSNYIVLSDGAGNPRGIYDAQGNYIVGTTTAQAGTASDAPGLTVYGSSAGANVTGATVVCRNAAISSNYVMIVTNLLAGSSGLINFNSGGAAVGSITYNGTNTLYNATSDQRLKENIVDAPSALDKINSIQVRSFDWKLNGTHTDFGVIAQELNEVAPECVTVGDDDEEIEQTWQVDTTPLVPALIKAIQELKAEVDSLKAQLGK